MKKAYQTPLVEVVIMKVVALNAVSQTEGNTDIDLGGEGKESDVARSRRSTLWDDTDNPDQEDF